ncbi:hypothetical protein [Curvibacter gracilis]|uniref:hypothetical protein n=1 Tax=Curvibacter gracilis TaxID=230310 RepID=UPI0012F9D604|nr:hypothetical protein [Curvibacter gracilis]
MNRTAPKNIAYFFTGLMLTLSSLFSLSAHADAPLPAAVGNYAGQSTFVYNSNNGPLSSASLKMSLNFNPDYSWSFTTDSGCAANGNTYSGIVTSGSLASLNYVYVGNATVLLSNCVAALGMADTYFSGQMTVTVVNGVASTGFHVNSSSSLHQIYTPGNLTYTGGINATPATLIPRTGTWWNPSEGGRGYLLQVSNDNKNLAFAIYGYDANGNPNWMQAVGTLTNGSFTGALQLYGGGQTLTGSYHAAQLVNANVGTVQIKFSDSYNATLTLPNGRAIPISYFGF